MKYKLQLTSAQMLTLYDALELYGDELEKILVDYESEPIKNELFIVKTLRNRISAKLQP